VDTKPTMMMMMMMMMITLLLVFRLLLKCELFHCCYDLC